MTPDFDRSRIYSRYPLTAAPRSPVSAASRACSWTHVEEKGERIDMRVVAARARRRLPRRSQSRAISMSRRGRAVCCPRCVVRQGARPSVSAPSGLMAAQSLGRPRLRGAVGGRLHEGKQIHEQPWIVFALRREVVELLFGETIHFELHCFLHQRAFLLAELLQPRG